MTAKDTKHSSGKPVVRRRRRKRLVLAGLLAAAAAGLATWWYWPLDPPPEDWLAPTPSSGPTSRPTSGPTSAPAPGSDASYRQLALGTWGDEYKGKRTMTIRPDGTATMVVELDGLKAMMFASRLQFEMVWSIEYGRLKKRTVSGEPAAKVRLILKTMGDRVDEPILELTEDRLLLLDADGETQYDWRRVDPGE